MALQRQQLLMQSKSYCVLLSHFSVILKDVSCCKKEINEKDKEPEPEKKNESSAFEEGKQLLNTASDREKIIKNLTTLASEGAGIKDPKKGTRSK